MSATYRDLELSPLLRQRQELEALERQRVRMLEAHYRALEKLDERIAKARVAARTLQRVRLVK